MQVLLEALGGYLFQQKKKLEIKMERLENCLHKLRKSLSSFYDQKKESQKPTSKMFLRPYNISSNKLGP
jgi:hypothetical protein